MSTPIPAVVRSYVDSFSSSSLDAWINTFAADGAYSDPSTPTPIDPHGLKENFTGFFTAFPDVKFELVGLHAISESSFLWRWVMHATNSGPYRGFPASGKTINLPGCEIIETRGDKVFRVQGYFDRLTMMAQMGLVAGPPPK
jgi:steroid delta-isomerase-like uncharacterized protein